MTFQPSWCAGAITRADMAEIARRIAAGKEESDPQEAKRLRARAREIEFRDGWKGVRRRAERQERQEAQG